MALVFVWLVATAALGQVSVGASRKEVIDVLGWPKSTSVSANREMLSYPECNVLLENGRVLKLEFRTPRSQMLLWDRLTKSTATTSAPVEIKRPMTASAPSPAVSPLPPLPQPLANAPMRAHLATPDAPMGPFAFMRAIGTIVVSVGFVALAGLAVWHVRRGPTKSVYDRLRGRKEAAPVDGPVAVPPTIASTPKPDFLRDGWSLKLLKEIEWHQFERVVAAFERESGHDAHLTAFGPDDGIDVEIHDRSTGTVSRLIQCKAYNSRVKVDLIRAFYGVMAHKQILSGSFYTIEGFTADAVEFARGKNLALIDGATLVSRIKELELPKQIRLFDLAVEGDYGVPTCASCGIKMRLITKGARRFWGCTRYPRCRNKLSAR